MEQDSKRLLLGLEAGKGDKPWLFLCSPDEMVECMADIHDYVRRHYRANIKMEYPIAFNFTIMKAKAKYAPETFEVYFIEGGAVIEVTAMLPGYPTVPEADISWLGVDIEFFEIDGSAMHFVHRHGYFKDKSDYVFQQLQLIRSSYNAAKFLDTKFAAGRGTTYLVDPRRPQEEPTSTQKEITFWAPNSGRDLKYMVVVPETLDGTEPICNNIRCEETSSSGSSINTNLLTFNSKLYT